MFGAQPDTAGPGVHGKMGNSTGIIIVGLGALAVYALGIANKTTAGQLQPGPTLTNAQQDILYADALGNLTTLPASLQTPGAYASYTGDANPNIISQIQTAQLQVAQDIANKAAGKVTLTDPSGSPNGTIEGLNPNNYSSGADFVAALNASTGKVSNSAVVTYSADKISSHTPSYVIRAKANQL